MKFKSNNSNCLELGPTKDFFKEGVFENRHCLELLVHGDRKQTDFQLVLLFFKFLERIFKSLLLAPGTDYS